MSVACRQWFLQWAVLVQCHLLLRAQPNAPKNFERVEASTVPTASSLASQAELDQLVARISKVFTQSFRDLPPVPPDGGPLPIGVRINLVKFQGLDEVAGTVNLVLDLHLCWADDRLSIDSNRTFHRPWVHAGDKLPIRSSLVWTPDLVVLNQVEGMDKAFAADDSPLVLADDMFKAATGVNVMWQRRINVKSRCNVNMANFPFDEQVCSLVIGSWASSRRQMILVPLDGYQEVQKKSNIHSSEFFVEDIAVQKNNAYMRDAAETFDEIQYDLRFKRFPHFYIVNFIMPLSAVTMMTVATMWMSQTGNRINAGTRLILCVIQIMNITATWRPASHRDIWLDRFQSHCLVCCFAAVLQSLFFEYVLGKKLLEPVSSYYWLRPHALETAMRTAVCLSAVLVLGTDLFELKQQETFRGLYNSFHEHSSKLLASIVYILFFLLGTSSVVSAAWIVLPKDVWQRWCFRGCGKVAGDETDTERSILPVSPRDKSRPSQGGIGIADSSSAV